MFSTGKNSVSIATTRKVLERTKEVCTEAFRLVTCDDARKEGFFRRAEQLDEKLWKLHREWTRDGIILHDNQGSVLTLDNQHVAVRATISYVYNSEELQTRECIHITGHKSDGDRLSDYSLILAPTKTSFGVLLKARFHASRYDPKSKLGIRFPATIIDDQKINGDNGWTSHSDVAAVYMAILREYPKNNHELSRIALNLLAEFEMMLDSAIRHFET